MFKLVLSTKFNIPYSRTALVPRSRLVERLNEGAGKKLLLVSAPPGFGKTTLLSTWIQARALPAAWLSLDAGDNDPNHFLLCVGTALQGIGPEVGRTSLALLNSSQPVPAQTVLGVMVNELMALQGDFYLVLDDYHLIAAQEIHAALLFLIENLPEKMHIVLSTRSDPPFPISRLRARGQLTELRQADLRFTPEETADFLNQVLGLNLRLDQVRVLERRTEGWIAGLQLAGLSMQGKADRGDFIQKFGGSHKFVFDYLVEEVFGGQPAEMQQFLRQTSILDQFNASLCNAVTGREDAERLIRELETANLFLLPLDDQREWYRYHHLFQDFLCTRLEKPGQAELHRKAVGWLMGNGFAPEAVKHALACEDTGTAVQVVAQAARDAFNQGAFQTVLGWLDSFPEAVVGAHAELAVLKGLVLFLLRSPEEARPYVNAAENLLEDAPDATQGQYLYLKALLAMCDDQLDLCIEHARNALEVLGDDQPVLRNFTMNALGEVLDIKGDAQSAAEFYQQAFDAGWRSGDQVGALVLFTNLILTLNELGRRSEAEARCRRLAQALDAQAAPGSSLLEAIFLPWSLLAFETDQLDLAREYAQRALTMLTAVNFPQGITWAQYILAQVYLAEGRLDLLREIAEEGERLAAQMGMADGRGAWFTALQARANLLEGNLSGALRWVEKRGLTPQDVTYRWNEDVYITYVRILMAQERFTEAERLLQTMEESIRPAGRYRKLITIHILGSLLRSAQNRPQEAISRMDDAVKLAAPQGYSRAFLNEGQEITPLLTQVRSTAPGFVGDLLQILQGPDAPAVPAQGRYEALTEREQEVLRLVGRGYSNREIAAALFVTLGTVKKHLNNIFSKLDVKNRTQAVNRGEELGLF